MSNRRVSRKGLRPLARQVPKRDARVILLPLPASERVPPPDFPADHQMAQAPFRRIVVRRGVWMRHEDKQFLDVPFYPPA